MPRWLGAVVMIALGAYLLYAAIADPNVRFGGAKRALPIWLGRVYLGGLAAMLIVGGLLVWLGPFGT